MLRTQHGTATNYYGDGLLCVPGIPGGKTLYPSLECQSTLLLHDTPMSRHKSKVMVDQW